MIIRGLRDQRIMPGRIEFNELATDRLVGEHHEVRKLMIQAKID